MLNGKPIRPNISSDKLVMALDEGETGEDEVLELDEPPRRRRRTGRVGGVRGDPEDEAQGVAVESGVRSLVPPDEAADAETPDMECGICGEEAEEVRRPIVKRGPGEPTKEARREHFLTHTPYRSWCPECVRARGKAADHVKQEDQEKSVPSIHIDYWFMRDGRGEESRTVIEMKDSESKAFAAHAVPRKGDFQWAAKKMVEDLADMGHGKSKVIIKSDQENAIKGFAESVKKERDAETLIEYSKVKDSQSNGTGERSVQEHEGITRTMKLALERRLGRLVPSTHPVMTWLVEHAAVVLNRFHVSRDGRTPYERIRGKKYKGEITEFGRKVYHRHPGKVQGGSMEARWEVGIYVGKKVRSDENIIVSMDGTKVVKARSLKYMTESESWDWEAVSKIAVMPWQLTVEEDSVPREVRFEPRAEEADAERPPEFSEPVPKDIYIRAGDYEKYGYSTGCAKCDSIRLGRRCTRRHTPACRSRFRERMQEDEEGKQRMDRMNKRKDDYLHAYEENEMPDTKRSRSAPEPEEPEQN